VGPEWSNWAGDQRCRPAVLERPRSTEEVAAAVRAAARLGQVVRVAGTGHSFSDVVLTDGALLHLGAMDRLLAVDPAAGRARVQAGITLGALSATLAAHGLALPNLGDIDVQALGGAVATATHGTGARLPTISAQVTALQLVDGRGEVRELDGGEELLAGRVAVGALGVVTEVELAVVPAFTLRAREGPMPRAEALGRMHELAAEHDHFEFFAFPYARRVLAKRNDRVDAEPQPPSAARAWMEDHLVGNGVFGAAVAAGNRVPRAVPAINRALTAALRPSTRVDAAHRVFASPRRVRFTEMEVALPREAGRDAVEAILAFVERRRLPITFPLEIRFVAPDDALLSPAHGRESVYVAAHVPAGRPHEPLLREVEAIARAHGGRPHWGKRHFRTAEDLAPAYPAWERFRAVRRELDPEGRFANAYVRRVLGTAS
jgi:L-gulono-1,4-lactone dehydrogenase